MGLENLLTLGSSRPSHSHKGVTGDVRVVSTGKRRMCPPLPALRNAVVGVMCKTNVRLIRGVRANAQSAGRPRCCVMMALSSDPYLVPWMYQLWG